MYCVKYTVCIVCSVFYVLCAVYCMCCVQYTVCIVCSVLYVLCVVYSMYCVECTVCIVCSILYVLCAVYCMYSRFSICAVTPLAVRGRLLVNDSCERKR
jgi:hypothetical protein